MIRVDIDPNAIAKAVEGERIALAKRVRLATESSGRELLLEPLRMMTRKALNSKKLPTTWRANLYPKEARHTLTPAFFAFSRAPEIMIAFEEGATIQPLAGKRYLWIPTENVPAGRGGKRMSPKEVLEKVGKFRFIPLKNGGLLAVGAAVLGRRQIRRHVRGKSQSKGLGSATISKPKEGQAGQQIAFFVLKKQVRLSKRLDIRGVADRAGAKYAANYERAANGS